jgi:hypothetical protein
MTLVDHKDKDEIVHSHFANTIHHKELRTHDSIGPPHTSQSANFGALGNSFTEEEVFAPIKSLPDNKVPG